MTGKPGRQKVPSPVMASPRLTERCANRTEGFQCLSRGVVQIGFTDARKRKFFRGRIPVTQFSRQAVTAAFGGARCEIEQMRERRRMSIRNVVIADRLDRIGGK